MAPQVYLIAPPDAELPGFLAALRTVLGTTPAAALLLPRGTRAENAYKALVKAVVAVAQPAGCAVLVEGEPGLVRTLGADGLHVTGDAAAAALALGALKPDHIVGAGGVRSRHEAMAMAEAGVDYILFGPLSGAIEPAQRELARWWAETMEIPSVLSDPQADAGSYEAEGCEFIGLGLSQLETQP